MFYVAMRLVRGLESCGYFYFWKTDFTAQENVENMNSLS